MVVGLLSRFLALGPVDMLRNIWEPFGRLLQWAKQKHIPAMVWSSGSVKMLGINANCCATFLRTKLTALTGCATLALVSPKACLFIFFFSLYLSCCLGGVACNQGSQETFCAILDLGPAETTFKSEAKSIHHT